MEIYDRNNNWQPQRTIQETISGTITGTRLLGESSTDTYADRFGQSLDLSSDGLSLVVGSPSNNTNHNDDGQVEVFAYDGTDWAQTGNDIEHTINDRSNSEGNNFGTSVSI